jgi:hypothetical protein
MKNIIYGLIALVCTAQSAEIYSANQNPAAAAAAAASQPHTMIAIAAGPQGVGIMSINHENSSNGFSHNTQQTSYHNPELLNPDLADDLASSDPANTSLTVMSHHTIHPTPLTSIFPLFAWKVLRAEKHFVPFIDAQFPAGIRILPWRAHQLLRHQMVNPPSTAAEEAGLYTSAVVLAHLRKRYDAQDKLAAHNAKAKIEAASKKEKAATFQTATPFTTPLQHHEHSGLAAHATHQVETANIAARIGYLASAEEDDPEAARQESALLMAQHKEKLAAQTRQTASAGAAASAAAHK